MIQSTRRVATAERNRATLAGTLHTPPIPMTRWIVSVPTLHGNGAREVGGKQIWVLEARHMLDAVHQALIEALTPDALRHRRGASLDTAAATVTRWDGGPLGVQNW